MRDSEQQQQPSPPAFTTASHGGHEQRASAGGAAAWTGDDDSSDSQEFAPHHVPGDAGASDEEIEGLIRVPVRDSASHGAFVWTSEPRGADSLHHWMEGPSKLDFASLPGFEAKSQPFPSEFILPPAIKIPARSQPSALEADVPLKDLSEFSFADQTFASTGGHNPAKIVETLKSALAYFDALEFKEIREDWRFEVSCLCVAERIDFSIELARLGDDGSAGDRNSFEVAFHRTFGDEARYLELFECIRSRCREVDNEPLFFVPETLEPWMDARQEITSRRAAIGPKDALELIKQLHADLHVMTHVEVAKEIKDHCRHKGNRKTFHRVDPKNFLSGLREMLSSSNTEMSRFGVFILLQFARDHDLGDRSDRFSPFFHTPYDRSSFSMLLNDVLAMHENAPCGAFTAEMVRQVQQSWLFALDKTKVQTASDTTRFVLLSTVDGSELEVITSDANCDVDSVEFSSDKCVPQYVVFNYTKPRVEVLDESVRADVEHLVATCSGSFVRLSVSSDELTWLYADNCDSASLKYYIYDRRTSRHALLFDSRPALKQYQLVSMTPHVIKTSDGEDMVVYVSLPLGVTPESLPFVVNVHGGPWYRDSWGLRVEHQFFANRGYGCISVNFRGSTGFGKRWGNLSNLEWGGKMQQDVADAAEWTIKQGLADKNRVAIYGGSFGGYSTLCGLAFKPDLYACGVDVVGPSNLRTMLSTFPLYWEVLMKMFELRIGPIMTDDAFNERHSPLFHADKITKPLLIAQGANDPRVKQAESDQIAKKLYEQKHDVTYVLYSDEGHGFARPVNNIDFYSRADAFLAKYLGGRYLPVDKSDIKGTTGVEVDVAAL